MTDPYKVLGVSKDASDEEIKRAYKKLAVKFHPDKHGNTTSEKFKEVQSAYDKIETAEKRKQFDLFGADGPRPFQFHTSDMDLNSIFGDFFNMGRSRRQVVTGEDIYVGVTCTLEEAYTGFSRDISYKGREICNKCKGTGAKKSARCSTCNGSGFTTTVSNLGVFQTTTRTACMHCRGKGEVVSEVCGTCQGAGFSAKKDRHFHVSVPAGIESGSKLRFTGEGEPSPDGQPGNLYVEIMVEPHVFFSRQKQNLLCTVPLTYSELVNGKKVKIKSFDTNLEFEVPAGTSSGTKFSLSGQGFPLRGFVGRGDILVEVVVDIPKHLSSEYKAEIDKLRELEAKYVSEDRKKYVQYLASEEKYKK